MVINKWKYCAASWY